MTKIILSAYKAERFNGGIQIEIMGLFSYRKTVEVEGLQGIKQALANFCEDVKRDHPELSGFHASAMLARGERAPNGYKKAEAARELELNWFSAEEAQAA